MVAKARKLKDLMNKVFSTRVDDPVYTEHASHTFFDEFSDDYMSSGEGGQYYGKGHYTSTHPVTHDTYKDQFRKHKENKLGVKSESVDRRAFLNYLDETDQDEITRAVVARALDEINEPNHYSNLGDWKKEDLHNFVDIVTDENRVNEILESLGYVTDYTTDYVHAVLQKGIDKGMLKPENYAASMGVNLHLDPDRVLELDDVVEDEMLELLRGRGGTPDIALSSLPDDHIIKRYMNANDRIDILNAQTEKVQQEMDIMRDLLGDRWYSHPKYKALQNKLNEIGQETIENYKIVNSPENRKAFYDALKEEAGSSFPPGFYERRNLVSSGDYGHKAPPDYVLKEGTPGFDPEKFKEEIKRHQRYDEPTNKNLANYLDKEFGTRENPMRGQHLLKEIGLQASRHLDYGSRHGMTEKDYHNYITFYPELMEIVKKEKGNIHLGHLLALSSAGAALPPPAEKLVADEKQKIFATSVAGGYLTAPLTGIADILRSMGEGGEEKFQGATYKKPDVPFLVKGADKIDDLAEWAKKRLREAGGVKQRSKGAESLGELVGPGI